MVAASRYHSEKMKARAKSSVGPAVAIVLILMVVHAALAGWFAQQTPYRKPGVVMGGSVVDVGAPDERQHVNYIRHLRQERNFPIFRPGSSDLGETYQSHQPPMFYALAATLAGPLGVTDETSPDGARLRFINVIIGALTVGAVFLLGFWGAGSAWVGNGGAAIAAVLPMNVALSGAVSNDPLLFLLMTLALALTLNGVNTGWSPAQAIAVGLCTAGALLTKTTALALLPALFVCLVWPKAKRPSAGVILVMVLVAFLGPAAWWIRNTQLYGDPFALRAFTEAFVGSAQKEMFVTQIIPTANPGGNAEQIYWMNWVAWWTFRSFIGVFGYMDVWLTPDGRQPAALMDNQLYLVPLALLVIGWLLWFVSWKDAANRILNAAGLILVAVVAVLFVRFNMQYFQAQARYLYPAIGPLAVFAALGYRQLGEKRGSLGLGLLVLVLLSICLFAGTRMETWFAGRVQ